MMRYDTFEPKLKLVQLAFLVISPIDWKCKLMTGNEGGWQKCTWKAQKWKEGRKGREERRKEKLETAKINYYIDKIVE